MSEWIDSRVEAILTRAHSSHLRWKVKTGHPKLFRRRTAAFSEVSQEFSADLGCWDGAVSEQAIGQENTHHSFFAAGIAPLASNSSWLASPMSSSTSRSFKVNCFCSDSTRCYNFETWPCSAWTSCWSCETAKLLSPYATEGS